MRIVPRDWPIAWRITAGLLIAGIVPLGVVTYLGAARGAEVVEDASYRKLRLMARVTAARIDQFLDDYRVSLRAMRRSPSLLAYLEGDASRRGELEESANMLAGLDNAIATLFFTDPAGKVLLATNPKTANRDVSFRRYWQEAKAGREYISTLLVGKHTGEAGIYIAGPIRREGGPLLGVAVLKLDAGVVDRYVQEVALSGEGGAALIDDNGVILAGARPELRFHTMRPLSEEEIRRIDPEKRWGVATLPLGPFARAEVIERGLEGDTWRATIDGETYYAGSAGLETVPWSVVAFEPKSQLDQPVRQLLRQQLGTIALVSLFTLLFVFSHTRSILQPVRRLSRAADRLAAGDLAARAEVRSDDELGRLARAFNRMVPELQAGVDMKNSLELAQEVQRNLLPDGPPDFPGVDLAGHSIAADETGGDYFDFIDLRPFGDERLAVAIGDVVGHGVAAALLMATARANLRARGRPLGDLGPLFDGLNRLLCEDVRHGQFMTLLLMAFDPATRRAHWVNAGHQPPFHLESGDRTVSERASDNVPLGILPEWRFEPSDEIELAPGDVLLLGTDGIWEAVNPRDEQYGRRRVAQLLQRHAADGAQGIVDALLEDLERFREGAPFQDDVTVVVMKVT